MRKSGVTLVEVVVCLAIITLVTALTAAVILRTKAAARRSHCAANVGQLGKAALLYANDHDDRIVPYDTEGQGNDWDLGGAIPWRNQLIKYNAASDQFFCPDDPVTNETIFASRTTDRALPHGTGIGRLQTSYQVHPITFIYLRRGSFSLTAIENPSSSPYIYDAPIDFQKVPEGSFIEVTPHGTFANAFFLDGHVKFGSTNPYVNQD